MSKHQFESSAHLAAFLGVCESTLYAWSSGKRRPCRAAVRLLEIMGLLEGTPLYDVLVEQARPRKQVETKPALPVLSPFLAARMRETRLISNLKQQAPPKRPKRPVGTWGDSYWFERSTSSEAAWRDGENPAVRVRVAELRRMTDEQESAFWDAAIEYGRRTGRFVPEAED